MDNVAIGHRLLRLSREMAANGENLYRVQAYRRAAARVFGLDRSVRELVAEAGVRGLMSIPDIGASLAKAIAEMAAATIANSAGESDRAVGGS